MAARSTTLIRQAAPSVNRLSAVSLSDFTYEAAVQTGQTSCLESLGCERDSRLLLQVVQECIGFCFSSSTSLCWLPWTILRSLLFKLLSAVWPQTAARLLASCHLQQAEHVLVKVCLHQPSFEHNNSGLHVQPCKSACTIHLLKLLGRFCAACSTMQRQPTMHAAIVCLAHLPRQVAYIAGLKMRSMPRQDMPAPIL